MHLPPNELAVLHLLLARAGEIVAPLELSRALGTETPGDGIATCVASLRARLRPADCIQSVYKRGYRFFAAVELAGLRPAGVLPRLAILPFASGLGVPDYLGMAVTEETIERLKSARCPIASLVARDSVFALAQRGMAPLEIGRALGADLVLIGLLLAAHKHDRLRAEMIRANDGASLWVEDMFIKRDPSGALSSELLSRLTHRLHSGGVSISAVAEPEAEIESPSHRSEAYHLYQRAHHEWQTLERHRMRDALGNLLRAIELDPSLMPARADLADLAITQALYGVISPVIEAGMVRRAAERIPLRAGNDAGENDPADALLPSLGWIDFHVDHNLRSALNAFARSAHLPHDLPTTRARVLFALSRNRFREAIDLLREAIDLDPYSPWLLARLAWALHLAGDSAASVAQILKALALFPDNDSSLLFGAIILSYNGDGARVIEMSDSLAKRSAHFDHAAATDAYILASAGRGDEARELLEHLQWLGHERFVQRSFKAAAYVALGELDAALAALRASRENRCPWFFQMIADPRLKPLWDHPEFQAMRSIRPAMEADAEESAMD